jgi:hypothetical protein
MAHFFVPSHSDKQHGLTAAFGGGILELVIRRGQAANVGLWGGGPDGKPLQVKVTRGGQIVSEGKAPAVRLARTSNDTGNHIQVFQVSGLKDGDQITGFLDDGTPYTRPLAVRELTGSANDIIEAWAKARAAGEAYTNRGLYPQAVPYLELEDARRGIKMAKLADKCIGGPISDINGLSVHSTAGFPERSAFQMTRFGCVDVWNGNGASAHFGIAGDGTVVQFIPATFAANAQFNPGNRHWLSVEIDNNGKDEMTDKQLTSAKALFFWVCNTFGVAIKLATGCLFPKTPQYDATTMAACAMGKSPTTTDVYEAVMSEGVSCHWWLEGPKNAKSHGCPGEGIMMQLYRIARS